MTNTNEVNISSIAEKLPSAAFGLFRFWTDKVGLSEKTTIKNEQILIHDLKNSIEQAVKSLLLKENLDGKPMGWDIGFVLGFTGSNLERGWHHDYITRNSETYKTFAGLKAIETFLKFDDLAKIRINEMYRYFMENDSNIAGIELDTDKNDFIPEKLKISKTSETGKITAIVNNLIIQQIIKVSNIESNVQLPVQDYLSTEYIEKLIADNSHIGIRKTG